VTTVAAVLALLLGSGPARASLTEAPRLAAVYDAILAARFDRVEAQLKQACPPAPAEACAALSAVSLWWQILLDPDSRQFDGRFNDQAAAAVAASTAWTIREPQRAEAWFYLAGAYAPLVQWRVLRGERLAAAREAKKIKDALERTLELDPGLDDAHFGIGAYHYYAAVAPTAAKILRWLLFLPGGDRVKGLQEMLQAGERGVLLRGEADYQLHLIYLWYEQKPARALELLAQLDARYPTNPLFQQRIADVQDVYFHDLRASAAAWQTVIDRARAARVYNPSRTEARAHIGYARLLERAGDRARAIESYRNALRVAGSDPRTRDDARAALKRLGAS
jgi:tetratricopeptide (TPR) repeat protein